MINLMVNKEDIVEPLSIVQSVVDRKSIMNVINNVFIHTDENFLYIEATNFEISYRGKIPCNIESQGAITINAKKLYEIIRDFPSDVIKIKEIENFWLVIGDRKIAEYKIGGMSGDDFPVFRTMKDEKFYEIESEKLREMIEKTIFSVSLDDKKRNLTGILLEKEHLDDFDDKTVLRMVSSDGHRLNLCEQIFTGDYQDFAEKILIPRKGASEIKKLSENNDILKIGIEEDLCFVQDESGNNQIVIMLLKEIFPAYKKIIPDIEERVFYCDNTLLFNALKRISILIFDSDFRGVKAVINKSFIEITSIETKIGEAREVVNIDYDGEPFTIAFNAKYMMDVISIMKSETIKFIINNEDAPFILKGDEDKGFTGVIMPMSIENN